MESIWEDLVPPTTMGIPRENATPSMICVLDVDLLLFVPQ